MRLKPIYQKDEIMIYNADCFDVFSQVTLPPVDFILTDLPYAKTDLSWDSMLGLDSLWQNFRKVRKDNAVIALFGQGVFSARLVMSNFNEYRHVIIWHKDKSANFMHAKFAPITVTEDILIFCLRGFPHNAKNRATYNPQMVMAERTQASFKGNDGQKISSLDEIRNRPESSRFKPRSAADYDGKLRYPTNIIYCPVPYGKARKHPTQKPVELLRKLIRTYSNKGELILDCTMGVGSTLVAARLEGRRAIGIELDLNYCQIAIERLTSETRQLDLGLF